MLDMRVPEQVGVAMKLILDANVLRALPFGGQIAEDLFSARDRLILIDSLLYEISSSKGVRDWAAELRKLRIYADRCQYWIHVGEALHKESEIGSPCSMYHERMTRCIRTLLVSSRTCNDVKSAVSETRKQREGDSVRTLFSSSGVFRQLLPTIAGRLHGESPDAITDFATSFVNDKDNIRLVLGKGALNPVFNADLVNENWVAWHHAKAFLAFLCEFMRTNPSADINALSEAAQHRWINSKIDLDYAISTAFADGILTQERKALRYICLWMFGDSRRILPE